MTEKTGDSTNVAAHKDPGKKKKTKRITSSRKESGMSSSGRLSGSASRRDSTSDGEEKYRQRSRSVDRVMKQRRDSGIRENKKERSSSGEANDASHRSRDGGVKDRSGRTSPLRPRTRSKLDGKGDNSSTNKGGSHNHLLRDRSRSRSPNRPRSPVRTTSSPAAHAPRLPQRTVSDASALSATLEAGQSRNNSITASAKDSFDEASLGDYRLYSQQQQKKQQLNLNLNASRMMSDIPEESLGSFAAFATKYEQEKLLGLHDDDDGPDVYGQYSSKRLPPKQPQQLQQPPNYNDASCSLGALMMNPMDQYGDGGNRGPPKPALVEESLGSFAMINNPMMSSLGKPKPPVEDSLGSFAMFQKNYEQENLLGLQESTISAFQSDAMLFKEKRPTGIPEESMGELPNDKPVISPKESKGTLEDSMGGSSKLKLADKNTDCDGAGEEMEKELHHEVLELPKNRIEKLGKRGGVGYKIVVDTPGGHFTQPMKIVVAIEFEDDSDEESAVGILSIGDVSIDVEEEDPLDNVATILNKAFGARGKGGHRKEVEEASIDEDNELEESGHLPLSSLVEDDAIQKEKISQMIPHKWKRQKRKSNDGLLGKKPKSSTGDDSEIDSEAEDDVGPLASNINRWKTPTAQVAAGATTPNKPERERSRHSHSTHSTLSSVTLGSGLEGGLPLRNDATPSHRKPGGVSRGHGSISNAALKRPSGVVKAGGTATLLGVGANRVTPHNLGTRRGLLLRQQSEASMISKESNDSSFVGANHDASKQYEASFMQLNLTNLGQTEMQTNEEVEQAKLPEQLRSGVEGIEENETNGVGVLPVELETIPEGKDPIVAASELLGMKTMLKHIKRVAPKRSKSFEFDREMPKQMWNKMFAKKGELPGSQYVDNHEDSFSGNHEDAEEKVEGAQNTPEAPTNNCQSTDEQKEQKAEVADEKTRGKGSGLFSSITSGSKATETAEAPKEKKEKKSFWSRTIKSVIPSSKEANASEAEANATDADANEATQEHTENTNDDNSEGSMDMDGILEELNQSLAHHMDGSNYGDEPMSRSRRDFSSRRRPSRGDGPRKVGTARSRANRAQQVHNRSLTNTLDYYTAEQEDDDLPQLDAINEEDETKKRPRVRPRRKPPHRTKSADEGMNRSSKIASGVHRTRSQETSPSRSGRDTERMMHKSFSGVEPDAAPPIRRQASRDNNMPSNKAKMRDPQQGIARTRSGDRGPRGSIKNIKKPVRKRSNGGVDEEPYVAKRGAELPEDATEEQLRELLDYH